MAGEKTALLDKGSRSTSIPSSLGMDDAEAGEVGSYAAVVSRDSIDWTQVSLGTWDEMWRILCDDTQDYLGRYFPFMAFCVKLICQPLFIIVGVAAALYNGVAELAMISVKGPSWATAAYGASCFALAVAMVIVPRAVKGAVFTGELLETDPNGTSYYEALDVMIKDLLGDVKNISDPGEVVRSCRSSGVDRMKQLNEIRWRSATYAMIGVFITGGATAIGLWHVYLHVASIRHVRGYDGQLPMLHMLGIPDVVMHFTGFLAIATALQVICVSADLHRAHTQVFVRWLSQFRTKEPSTDPRQMDALRFQVGEAYLLIQKLFNRSSESWSFPLTVWIILSASLALSSAVASLMVPEEDETVCATVAGVNSVVCLIPILIVAYANGLEDDLATTIIHSKAEDFKAIGGRQAWVLYIKDNPIYWYIQGVAITRSWLLGFVSSVVSLTAIIIVDQLHDTM